MKIWGILFVVFGAFWNIAGFVSYKSDIQLGIALAGINMFGIGYIMFRISKLTDIKQIPGDSDSQSVEH